MTRTLGARWLPCYLDLKHVRGRKIATLLSQTGYYPVLYFAREDSRAACECADLLDCN